MWYLDAKHLLQYLKQRETPDQRVREVTEQIRLGLIEASPKPR